jgi:hypothetical protein
MEKTRDQLLAAQIADGFNSYGTNPEKVAEAMSCQHRTLQQNFTRFCVAWLANLSRQANYDLRNEASVKLGKKFMEVTDEVDRSLPFI